MKQVSVYNNGDIINTYFLNPIQAIDFVSNLLSGTNYDIIITNTEDYE